MQERRKKGSKQLGKSPASAQLSYAKSPAMPQQPIQIQSKAAPPVNPLVKQQQEKELKKLEEQKRSEYEDKKNSLQSKNESRKDELMK